MKPKSTSPRPVVSPPLETLGGAYHRLESTFQPRNVLAEEGQADGSKEAIQEKAKRKKTPRSADA
jgi:hypothetical protein